MVDFNEFVVWMKDSSFLQVVGIFLLVYTLVYVTLEKSKVFYRNKDGKSTHLQTASMLISFVFGLFATVSSFFVENITQLITYSIMLVITILVLLIIFGSVFGEDWTMLFKTGDKWNVKVVGSIAGVLAIIIFSILFYVLGWLDWISTVDTTGFSENFWTIFIVVAILGVLFMVSKDDSETSIKKHSKNLSEDGE